MWVFEVELLILRHFSTSMSIPAAFLSNHLATLCPTPSSLSADEAVPLARSEGAKVAELGEAARVREESGVGGNRRAFSTARLSTMRA